MNKRGFTLIELLVVIAIIAILAAILFPVYARVKESGKQDACLSNERQWSMAVMMYASDWHDRLPKGELILPRMVPPWPVATQTAYCWSEAVFPYARSKTAYVCPSLGSAILKLPSIGAWPNKLTIWESTGYGINIEISGNTPQNRFPATLGEIRSPGRTVLLAEGSLQSLWGAAGAGWGHWGVDWPSPPEGYPDGWGLGFRHSKGMNVAFLDQHVRWMTKDQLRPNKSLSETDRNYSLWDRL